QLVAGDLGDLLHGQLDLEDVAGGLVAGAGAGLALAGRERVADVAVALADADGALLAEAELGDLDLRQRDRDEVLALAADQLAAADVLGQPALDLAADDPAEPLVIALDPLPHDAPPRKRATTEYTEYTEKRPKTLGQGE